MNKKRHNWVAIPREYKVYVCAECGIVKKFNPIRKVTEYFKQWLNGAPVYPIGIHAPECYKNPDFKLSNII